MKNLNAHIKSQHVSTKEKFHCDECESSFKKRRRLAAHKRLKQGQGEKEADQKLLQDNSKINLRYL